MGVKGAPYRGWTHIALTPVVVARLNVIYGLNSVDNVNELELSMETIFFDLEQDIHLGIL